MRPHRPPAAVARGVEQCAAHVIVHRCPCAFVSWDGIAPHAVSVALGEGLRGMRGDASAAAGGTVVGAARSRAVVLRWRAAAAVCLCVRARACVCLCLCVVRGLRVLRVCPCCSGGAALRAPMWTQAPRLCGHFRRRTKQTRKLRGDTKRTGTNSQQAQIGAWYDRRRDSICANECTLRSGALPPSSANRTAVIASLCAFRPALGVRVRPCSRARCWSVRGASIGRGTVGTDDAAPREEPATQSMHACVHACCLTDACAVCIRFP